MDDGSGPRASSSTVRSAAALAAARVEHVGDSPAARRRLLMSSYTARSGARPAHLRYRRAAVAFMEWQIRRGLLDPLDGRRPGSPWWRAVNGRLLRDTCEARLRLLGHPGPASSASAELSTRFALRPSPRSWYRAHNASIVSAYLEHASLAEHENRSERFFLNLVLVRVLYAHSLVAAPKLALSWLAPIGPLLGDPRTAMTGIFLSISRVLPDVYPLDEGLDDYIGDEHTVGRLLDLGVILPRLAELYAWSASDLAIPELAGLVSGGTPTYAWDPADDGPWKPSPSRLVLAARRAVPA